jgi:uroporphyrinogen III methyltransferase/synthase
MAREAGVRPPALLVIGEVVATRDALAWYERLPLFGQRIIVTRPASEARRAADFLEAQGAEVILAPTVEIRPITDPKPLDAAIERLGDFDWLVFTSANGVRFFLDRLVLRGKDLRALGQLRIAAIGPATAEALAGFHLRADLVPATFRSESLSAALADIAGGRKILLARADRGRTLLRDELAHVANVEQVPVYHHADAASLPDGVVERILDNSVDWVTLTSSAIASRFHALLPEDARKRIGERVRIASLSPVTSEIVARLGWVVDVEAMQATWESLIDALAARVQSQRHDTGEDPAGPGAVPSR